MRAAKIHGVGDVRVHHEGAIPSVKHGEVLVRILAVGVCGSDVHYYQEGGIGTARIEAPMTPGHEVAGEVVNGTGREFGFGDGVLVAIDPAQPCRECETCHAGYQNLCPNVQFLGTPAVDGGLADYMAVPAGNLVRLPAELDATKGALLEPLGVALHALDITRVKPMSGVAVVGAGPIGLLVAQLARVVGAAHVRVIEPHAGRREAARRLGFYSVHADWEEAMAATGGHGEPFVIECTNSADGPVDATSVAAIGGRVTLVGIPEGDAFSLSSGIGRRKGLTLKFSRRMGNVYPRAIELVRQGRVDLDALVSHRYPLACAEEAFATASRLPADFVKAVIYPAEG